MSEPTNTLVIIALDDHPNFNSRWWTDVVAETWSENVVWVGDAAALSSATPSLQCESLDAALSLDVVRASNYVWIARAGIPLPNHWSRRLSAVLNADSTIAAASATSHHPNFSPVLPDTDVESVADINALDAAIFSAGRGQALDIDAINPDCAIIRGDALVQAEWNQLPIHWERSGSRTVVIDTVWAGDPQASFSYSAPDEDADHPLPAHPLIALRNQMHEALKSPLASDALPGVDGKAVQLHIVHSWGGGIARWCEDYAAADQRRTNLFLCSSGDPFTKHHGQFFKLRLGCITGPVVRQWDLPRPIRSTHVSNPQYVALLEDVIGTYAVDGLVVSSLVGHSLDVFRTDKPTTVVLHDYYPAWPLLDEWFEQYDGSYNIEHLKHRLDAADQQLPFENTTPELWIDLRNAWLKAVQQSHVKLVTPNASVPSNLARIEGCENLTTHLIPHGSNPLERAPAPPPGRLRVVVLGQLSAAKGADLIAESLADITEIADVYLLGCGRGGNRFLGRSHVHVVPRYQHDDLASLVAAIRPHVGLLLSQVSETWSYTLTELWDLGIVPIATGAGALAERILAGRNGWIIEPTSAALTHQIKQAAEDMSQLEHMREELPRMHASGRHMVAAYQTLMPLTAREPQGTTAPHVDAATVERLTTQEQLRREVLGRRVAEKTVGEQRKDLSARAVWAQKLQGQVEQRTAWAKSLEAHLDHEQKQATALAEVVESKQQEIEARSQELADVAGRLNDTLDQLDDRTRWAQSLDHTVDLMRRSRSWQLTKPLRLAARIIRRLRGNGESQLRRTRYVASRTKNSLRVRGVAGTVKRVRDELKTRTNEAPSIAIPTIEDRGQPIRFDAVTQPRGSIVIPVYNHWDLTRQCLLSLMEIDSGCSFEVIVVDDCSSDETDARLAECQGLTAVEHEVNQGFVGACNSGAAKASGEFLVFLNNDTTVTEGWLSALLDTFDAHSAGLVGSKLVYPDGRLQEAGGVVFSDASGWNYGKFESPDDPKFNYVRETDYCSGAAIALRRTMFEKLGGFDNRYAPAYYEDTDLAFQIRQQGQRVMVQPSSTVVHHEGATAGTDTGSGVKKHQIINQSQFAEKWADALKQQPAAGTPIERAKEHRAKGRLLMIDATVPAPDKDSGSVRLVNLIKLLIDQGIKVTFFAHNRARPEPYTTQLQQLGVEMQYSPYLDAPENYLAEHGALFDWVFVSRHYVAREYIKTVRRHCPKARFIFDTVDLHYLREERLAALETDAGLSRTAASTKLSELELVAQADITLVVGDYEAETLRKEVPQARVEVLSNIHSVQERTHDFSQRKDIYFVGGYQHPPNIDAVTWFVNDIWPLIRAELPTAEFHIVGSSAPASVKALTGDGVNFVGFVPELTPYLDGCRISVAPLRYGAGVKGKVNSAMAHGQPVVATPQAVEGMSLTDGVDVLTGADPQSFADAVIRAYLDAEIWETLSRGGQENVRQHFSFETAKAAVARIFKA